jgi:hypothetical protein
MVNIDVLPEFEWMRRAKCGMNNASNHGDLRHPPFILGRTNILRAAYFFWIGNKSTGRAVYPNTEALSLTVFDTYVFDIYQGSQPI